MVEPWPFKIFKSNSSEGWGWYSLLFLFVHVSIIIADESYAWQRQFIFVCLPFLYCLFSQLLALFTPTGSQRCQQVWHINQTVFYTQTLIAANRAPHKPKTFLSLASCSSRFAAQGLWCIRVCIPPRLQRGAHGHAFRFCSRAIMCPAMRNGFVCVTHRERELAHL